MTQRLHSTHDREGGGDDLEITLEETKVNLWRKIPQWNQIHTKFRLE